MSIKPLMETLDLAVVGAGASSAALIETLLPQGLRLAAFEKSRGPGGRLSVRRSTLAEYNHGCSPSAAAVQLKLDQSDERHPNPVAPFVPANQEIKRAISGGSVNYERRIQAIERHHQEWILKGADGEPIARSQAVVVALPAPQANDLLKAHLSRGLEAELGAIAYEPAWAVMLSFYRSISEAKLRRQYSLPSSDFAELRRAKSADPGDFDGSRAWSLIASSEFSFRALEWQPQAVCSEFMQQTGIDSAELEECLAHRWRYAKPMKVIEEPGFWSQDAQLGIVGDFYGSASIAPLQRAVESGRWLAAAFLSSRA